MTNKELAAALRLCGGTSGVEECRAECPFFRGADVGRCVPVMTAACADALENSETHIMALQQEIERLRGQLERRWVSVEERLPGVGATVLACDYDGHIETGERNGSGWIGGWLDECAAYWMPLPEPPEKALKEVEK